MGIDFRGIEMLVAQYLLQPETMEREEFVAVFDQPDAQKAEQPAELPVEKQEPQL